MDATQPKGLSHLRSARFGHMVGGVNPGPSVLIAAHDPIATMVFHRLLELPTLDRMHGSLALVTLCELDAPFTEQEHHNFDSAKPDEVVFLPYHLDQKFHESAANEGYWTVLRICTSLGMIAGRGVPNSTKIL